MHRKYSYSQHYFTEGMTGWHGLSFATIRTKFAQFAAGSKIERLLDFGCGDGFYGCLLAQAAVDVDGVDLSAETVTEENRRCYRFVFETDLGQQWTPPSGAYDALFSSEVIEHVEDYPQFLANAFTALIPGGQLFLTTTTYACSLPIFLMSYPREVTLASFVEFFRGLGGDLECRSRFVRRTWTWTKGHHHGFSKRQLRAGLEAAGFSIDVLDYLHVQPVIDPAFFRNPFRNAPLRPLVLTGAAIARSLIAITNYVCRKLNLYAPNVLVVASKTAPARHH